jgi:hypothetical protein
LTVGSEIPVESFGEHDFLAVRFEDTTGHKHNGKAMDRVFRSLARRFGLQQFWMAY